MIGWMRLAIAEAKKGVKEGHGGPFGAVVIHQGRVVGRAHNEVLHRKDPTAHAEVLAIRQAAQRLGSHDLSECELYTTCEPCPMCAGAIQWARIAKIFMGCRAADAKDIGFDDAHFHEEPIRGQSHGREECLELFQWYASQPDQKRY